MEKENGVALNKGFFTTLPKLKEVEKSQADIAWFIYDLIAPDKSKSHSTQQLQLVREKVVYTKFEEALNEITKSRAGKVKSSFSTSKTRLMKSLKIRLRPRR